MKRFILAGLTTLALSATVNSAGAEPTALNPDTPRTATTYRMAPSELATLAHRGYLKAQGIPGYLGLTTGYISGQIQAADIVRGAIAAGQLPAEAATDSAYLKAVESQLQTLEDIH